MRKNVTIGLVGAGGVGVVTIGEIILALAQTRGFYGRLGRYYDAQIRGGGSAVKISLSQNQDCFPEDGLDVLVCFSTDKFREFKDDLSVAGSTMVFFEEDQARQIFSNSNLGHVLFGEISQALTESRQNKNVVALGLLLEILGLSDPQILSEIKEKTKILAGKNQLALMAGVSKAKDFGLSNKFIFPPKRKKGKTVILSGNLAISRAAIKAGCKFAATYPITPASDIGEDLSRELPKIGGVFLQSEDEIAAVCLALGASLAGAKAMTATSGPGFDLMTEAINLASSCEVPLIIVDVQRAGPSTGMPTKTEQSDLSAAIFSGHGYARRVILAPHNIEGCFRLTMEAFNISELLQVPVVLLSDQYLGQTFQIIGDPQRGYPVRNRLVPLAEEKDKYLRYRIAPSLVSPVARPGMEGFTWRATGLTHDEKGNPKSESSEWHALMQEKITRKLDFLMLRRDLVKIFGPKTSKVGLISWGSSAEVSLAVIKSLGLEREIKVCIPELISPMPKEIMAGFLKGLKKLIIVEMNYSGQYHGFLRRYFNLPDDTFVCKRAGGRPWSQKEIADFIMEAGI